MAKTAETFSVKDRVSHSVYGVGTISEMNARHTTIVFDEHGARKFLADVVRLEHSGTPAPVKAPPRKKAVKRTK